MLFKCSNCTIVLRHNPFNLWNLRNFIPDSESFREQEISGLRIASSSDSRFIISYAGR